MNTKLTLFVLVLVFVGSYPVYSQNFFWSAEDLNAGPIEEGDLVINAREFGYEGRLFLYYNPEFDSENNIENQLDLDFSWDGGGATFTDAETLDFDIDVTGMDFTFGQRWRDFAGPAAEVTPTTVEGFLAVRIGGGGGIQVDQILDSGNLFFDTGSTASGFFQIGFVDWEFTPGGTDSSLEIDNQILSGPGLVVATFNGLTITEVPEPTSSTVEVALLLVIASHRRVSRPRCFAA